MSTTCEVLKDHLEEQFSNISLDFLAERGKGG